MGRVFRLTTETPTSRKLKGAQPTFLTQTSCPNSKPPPPPHTLHEHIECKVSGSGRFEVLAWDLKLFKPIHITIRIHIHTYIHTYICMYVCMCIYMHIQTSLFISFLWFAYDLCKSLFVHVHVCTATSFSPGAQLPSLRASGQHMSYGQYSRYYC